MLLSGLVYKHKCGGYNATNYIKIKRHFKVRIFEYLGISHFTKGDPRTRLMLQLLSIL